MHGPAQNNDREYERCGVWIVMGASQSRGGGMQRRLEVQKQERLLHASECWPCSGACSVHGYAVFCVAWCMLQCVSDRTCMCNGAPESSPRCATARRGAVLANSHSTPVIPRQASGYTVVRLEYHAYCE